MRRDRPSALLEATSNLRSRILPSAVIASIVVATACATVSLSLAELRGVAEQQQALIDRGQYVFQIVDDERRPFSGRACDAMNTIEGVAAAGGMSSSRSVDLMFDRGRTYAIDDVTAGFAHIIWPDLSPLTKTGTVAGSNIAERFGLSDDSLISVTTDAGTGEVFPVGATATPSGRDGRYDDRMAVIVPSDADVVLCLVEAEVGAQGGVGAILDSSFSAEQGFSVLPLMLADTVSRTPQEQLDSRITAWTPLVGGLLAVALLMGSWLARSGEFGLYRLLGFSRWFILRLLVIEALYLVWSPIALGVFLALVMAPSGEGVTAGLLAADLMSLLLVATAAIPLGVALLAIRSPARMLKDVL